MRLKKKILFGGFLIEGGYCSSNKAVQVFLWLKMFQWDSDWVAEQVVVVCVGQGVVCDSVALFDAV